MVLSSEIKQTMSRIVSTKTKRLRRLFLRSLYSESDYLIPTINFCIFGEIANKISDKTIDATPIVPK